MNNPYRDTLEKFESGEYRWVNRCPMRINNGFLTNEHCLATALDVPLPASAIVAEVISQQFPDRLGHSPLNIYPLDIPAFNDHELTTYDDIKMVLEKSAIQWDEKYG